MKHKNTDLSSNQSQKHSKYFINWQINLDTYTSTKKVKPDV